MDAKEAIGDIRAALRSVKENQQKVVSVDALEKYLDELEKDVGVSAAERAVAHQANLEHYKAENEANLAQHRATIDVGLEHFQSVIQTGQAALRSAILINGGAAVALLAFLGRIWETEPSQTVVVGLPTSLLGFVFGVLAAAVASGTTYLAQFVLGENWIKTGHTMNIISILLVIVSYGLFVFGGYTAYEAFVAHLQAK